MKIFAIKQKRIQVVSAQSLVDTCQDVYKSTPIKFGGLVSSNTPQEPFSSKKSPAPHARSDPYSVKFLGGLY